MLEGLRVVVPAQRGRAVRWQQWSNKGTDSSSLTSELGSLDQTKARDATDCSPDKTGF